METLILLGNSLILSRYHTTLLHLGVVRALLISLPSCPTGTIIHLSVLTSANFACDIVFSSNSDWFLNRDSKEQRDIYGIKDNLIRFSVGVEDFEDLKNDIGQALDKI
jgi:hypothetical protein